MGRTVRRSGNVTKTVLTPPEAATTLPSYIGYSTRYLTLDGDRMTWSPPIAPTVGRQAGRRGPDRLAPSRTAVIVVDAQNDFCHADGVQAQQGRDVSRTREPLDRLALLLQAARACGAAVVFLRTVHSRETDTEEWLARHSDNSRPQSCQQGTWGADFCGVTPHEGDLVIVKHRYSGFIGTRLADELRGLGRSSLLFTGFTTNTCVESTLRDAVCLDFLATLVEDCCAAYTERSHARAVESVRDGFGEVIDSRTAITTWTGTGGAQSTGKAVSADA